MPVDSKNGFGTENGADPSKAGKESSDIKRTKHSIREQLRRLMAVGAEDVHEKKVMAIAKRIAGDGVKPSTAQLVAAGMFLDALKYGGSNYDRLINHIEGKLMEKTLTGDLTLVEILDAIIEEESDGA